MSNVLYSALVIMMPLLFAAGGGLYTELAGVLNIALEGLLLAGAFSAIAVTYYTGSFAAGIVAAIFVSTILSALFAFAALKLRSNIFIAGLAVNLLVSGLATVLSQHFFGTRGVVALPGFMYLPYIDLYFCAGILLLLFAWIALYRTPFGYRLRACYKNSEALVSLGIKPDSYRWAAFLISGFYCGIGGSFLSLNLGAFVPNMTAGKGWIALVVIFLGARTPLGILIAAFVFGLAESFSNYAQGIFNVPADFILAMPYIVTLLAMILVSVMAKPKDRVL